MNKRREVPILVAIIIIIVVGIILDAVIYLQSTNVEEVVASTVKVNGKNINTNINTNTFLNTNKDEITSWMNFNSVEDTGIKFNFSFKYPYRWFHIGSIDGGTSSGIPFYEKDKYPESWEDVKKGIKKVSQGAGAVAYVLVSGLSTIPAEIQYDDEKRENITIDDYSGTKISGQVKSGTSLAPYVGNPGQKESRIILPDVNGTRFNFYMVTESDEAEKIFDELIETIDF